MTTEGLDAGDIRAPHVPIAGEDTMLVIPMHSGTVVREDGYFVPAMDWKAISRERHENAVAAHQLHQAPAWEHVGFALALGILVGYILALLDRKPKLSLLKD